MEKQRASTGVLLEKWAASAQVREHKGLFSALICAKALLEHWFWSLGWCSITADKNSRAVHGAVAAGTSVSPCTTGVQAYSPFL